MTFTLPAPEVTESFVQVPVWDFDEPLLNTDYNGKDEKVAIVIGTVIIGIWLLRFVMYFLPFFLSLGIIIAIFALF